MEAKNIEYLRYNERSSKELAEIDVVISKDGVASMPYLIQAPFVYYEQLINQYVHKNTTVLDLCCGNGVHSLTAARTGANVIGTDIAENSIEIAKIRAQKAGLSNISFVAADAQKLPFENNQFDVITCLGSLSYVDLEIFTNEVTRLLKPGGTFICLDSFDHNPIYRLNRFVHYLRGNRSLSTLKRMPNNKTMAFLKGKFSNLEIAYFGIFSFVGGPLTKLVGEKKARELIDKWDQQCSFLKRNAFKIVFVAQK